MTKPEWAVLILYLAWNLFVFFLYGADKRRAQRGKWRISEKALILSAIFMGGIGALFGMNVFRHKTLHLKFKLGIPAAVIFNIAAAVFFIFLWRGGTL